MNNPVPFAPVGSPVVTISDTADCYVDFQDGKGPINYGAPVDAMSNNPGPTAAAIQGALIAWVTAKANAVAKAQADAKAAQDQAAQLAQQVAALSPKPVEPLAVDVTAVSK